MFLAVCSGSQARSVLRQLQAFRVVAWCVSARPLMRASHIHTNLLELESCGVELAARMRGRVAESTLLAVTDSSTVAWLPVEHDIEISRAVLDVVGVAGLRTWSMDAMARSAEGPLIRPLVEGAGKLFGVTPHALFRILPRGYGLVYRDCGENVYEQTGEASGVVTQTGIPSLFFEHSYLEGMAGAFQAFPRIFQCDAVVTLKAFPAKQMAVFEVAWEPRAR